MLPFVEELAPAQLAQHHSCVRMYGLCKPQKGFVNKNLTKKKGKWAKSYQILSIDVWVKEKYLGKTKEKERVYVYISCHLTRTTYVFWDDFIDFFLNYFI